MKVNYIIENNEKRFVIFRWTVLLFFLIYLVQVLIISSGISYELCNSVYDNSYLKTLKISIIL